MILPDTNIIIYLHDNKLSEKATNILLDSPLDTCNIIIAEVLGHQFIRNKDVKYFKNLFVTMKNHIFDKEITEKVIELRRTKSIKLPDAIIAATALVKELELWTHSVDDFADIPGLQLLDPFVEAK
jgi:predicted nucleic acid-binding protein